MKKFKKIIMLLIIAAICISTLFLTSFYTSDENGTIQDHLETGSNL